MEAANPLKENGKVHFDQKANERREDAMVKIMMVGEADAVIILGGSHDLTDNVGDQVEYIRIQTKHQKKYAGE